MSEIRSLSQSNYILATQQEVSHDNTLSGNGTVDSPLGVDSDYIVVTVETVGTYSVNTSDVLVENTFTKAGYKPIAWMYKFNQAGAINFNQERSSITSTNELYFQGYARRVSGSGAVSVTVKLFITWIKA